MEKIIVRNYEKETINENGTVKTIYQFYAKPVYIKTENGWERLTDIYNETNTKYLEIVDNFTVNKLEGITLTLNGDFEIEESTNNISNDATKGIWIEGMEENSGSLSFPLSAENVSYRYVSQIKDGVIKYENISKDVSKEVYYEEESGIVTVHVPHFSGVEETEAGTSTTSVSSVTINNEGYTAYAFPEDPLIRGTLYGEDFSDLFLDGYTDVSNLGLNVGDSIHFKYAASRLANECNRIYYNESSGLMFTGVLDRSIAGNLLPFAVKKGSEDGTYTVEMLSTCYSFYNVVASGSNYSWYVSFTKTYAQDLVGLGFFRVPFGVINNYEDFKNIKYIDSYHRKVFLLGDDIDCSASRTENNEHGFIPFFYPPFIDGCGHSISNLYINRDSDDVDTTDKGYNSLQLAAYKTYSGIFAIQPSIAPCVLKNITFENCNIISNYNIVQAGIIAECYGTTYLDKVASTKKPLPTISDCGLINCKIDGFSDKRCEIGGFAGHANTTSSSTWRYFSLKSCFVKNSRIKIDVPSSTTYMGNCAGLLCTHTGDGYVYIKNCYVDSSVIYVNGGAGTERSAAISYSVGSTSGSSIEDCWVNAGAVGDSFLYGITASSTSYCSVVSSYYNNELNVQAGSWGSCGKTANEMLYSENYVGWDFKNVWYSESGDIIYDPILGQVVVHDVMTDYPRLRWLEVIIGGNGMPTIVDYLPVQGVYAPLCEKDDSKYLKLLNKLGYEDSLYFNDNGAYLCFIPADDGEFRFNNNGVLYRYYTVTEKQ